MKKTIIPAIRNPELLETACKSNIDTIFLLNTNIISIEKEIELVHSYGKELFVHADFADGIGKDKFGMSYLKKIGVDGVLSTRSTVIKASREIGLKTVQRIFVVDTQSIQTAIDSTRTSKPNMIEIMPGIVSKCVEQMCAECKIPIIAGGLIADEDEVSAALSAGAIAVSTSNTSLWK